MKASEVYQKFIEEYRKANVIPENYAIEDGDMLDFICESVANNYFSNPFVIGSLPIAEILNKYGDGTFSIEVAAKEIRKFIGKPKTQ